MVELATATWGVDNAVQANPLSSEPSNWKAGAVASACLMFDFLDFQAR